MKTEFALALNEVLEDKKLPKEVIMAAIESAMASAYRKTVKASSAQEVQAKIDPETGEVKVFAEKEVIDEITDERTEVMLDEARLYNPEAQIGDMVLVESTPKNFGRVAAQTARQVIQQRFRDAERSAQLEYYGGQVGEIVNGVVQAVNSHSATIGLDLQAEGTMLRKDMIPGERLRIHERIRALVYEVKDSPRGPQILMSRGHRNFLRRLLENEVPEIYHGIVEIRSIAREPGHRAKVAVSAAQQGIDPVGACVGIRGVRIQTIVRELHDEKIDVIEWNSNPAVFIAKAISPARVSGVYLETEMKGNKTATVVVPEDQLSLAIGRQGQNARLAAKLTGWRIDIMSLTEATGKALLKLKENSSYAEMVESETENMLKIEDLLQKKAEGRPLPPEDYKFMSRFVDRIEKRGEAERKAEQDAEQARIAEIKTTIPKLAYEIPILDIELKRNVLEILRDAGIENLGDLIMQTRLDSDTILALNGIGPKTLERIIDFVENIKLPEESEQPDLVSISEAEQAEVSGELSQGKVLETEPEKGVSVEIKQDEQVEQVELESAAVESSKSEVVETGEEATTEEVPFEDLFKVDPKKFDFYPEGESSADDEGSELTPAKKKGKKSKRGFTVVEYDPDKDQTIVRRKRKRDDGWEEW